MQGAFCAEVVVISFSQARKLENNEHFNSHLRFTNGFPAKKHFSVLTFGDLDASEKPRLYNYSSIRLSSYLSKDECF